MFSTLLSSLLFLWGDVMVGSLVVLVMSDLISSSLCSVLESYDELDDVERVFVFL